MLLFFSAACSHFSPPLTGAKAATSESGWEVVLETDAHIATHPDWPNLRLPLRQDGGGAPEVISWEKTPKGRGSLHWLKYESGETGTSERTMVIRALVVDARSSEILVDEVYEFRHPRTNQRDDGSQPEWTWTPQALTIKRSDEIKSHVFPLQ